VEYFDIGPWWTSVKVDDFCDLSSVGTLTCVKSIRYVCKCVLPPIARGLQLWATLLFLRGRIGRLHDKSS
jgi:hypothetical protein